MNIRNLKIGIIHSIVGKNDGVSIVIDQTVTAMMEHMDIALGNFYFLAAYAPPRFNTALDEIFWHKNDVNRLAVKYFSDPFPPPGIDSALAGGALRTKMVIEQWIKENEIDLIIAHNTSHPYNFTTAVGLGALIEELRGRDISWPKCLVWWHDSFYERPAFLNPGPAVEKYLKYIPGAHNDGIIFINSKQPGLAKTYLAKYTPELDVEKYIKLRTAVIPNTCDIQWDWKSDSWDSEKLIYPPLQQYNSTFFRDCGLDEIIKNRSLDPDAAVFLLQHTRIVPRKRIDIAIDFAFRLSARFRSANQKRFIVLLFSGHSGDEQASHLEFLQEHYRKRSGENPLDEVIIVYGEKCILSSKDIIVDRKFYDFSEIPSVIAARGGMGTYFSEIEGFGNNLLEMVKSALPVIINEYEIYESDIKKYGFNFPSVKNCSITDESVEESFKLLTDIRYRNSVVKHNLQILERELSHKVIAENLEGIVSRIIMMDSV
ncbi:MAG: hypothetical protein A2020_15380 [Lentisphaerae bacterium GWF2_45_14]|nr:MAG: hypothetical protein A2020_15380 [Lentisphaerae bacterium GWF2_45_14]